MTGRARTAVFHGPGRPHELVTVPLPERLAAGERLVQVRCATICGSDLHTVAGRRREPTPCVLGHEGVGVVVAAADDQRAWLGRRITWSSSVGCGRCAACTRHGLPQKCREVFKYGHVGRDAGGALAGTYASHVLLHAGTHAVALPDELPDSIAVPANCALATMVAATEHLPPALDVAVVQGAGLLGLYGTALLRAAGYRRVLVVDPDEQRLAAVPAFGGEPVTGDATERVGAGTVDLVVEACGQPEAVADGLRLLRPGGRYTLAGLVRPGPDLPLSGEQLVRRCLTVCGVHNYAPRHLDRAVQFLAEHHHHLPLADLVSPPWPLADIDAALDAAAGRDWSRVLLVPEPVP